MKNKIYLNAIKPQIEENGKNRNMRWMYRYLWNHCQNFMLWFNEGFYLIANEVRINQRNDGEHG